MTLGLAGCLGGDTDNAESETGSGSEDDGDGATPGDSNATSGNSTDASAITIGHNTQTGRYVFEGGYPSAVADGTEPEKFIWDVKSVEGYDATVEATFIEHPAFGEETMSLTASPNAPDPTMTNPYQIGDGYDISELLSTRMVERWFPNYIFGEVDLGTVAVGAELDAQGFGTSFDVVGTETYAGIECYVVEAWLAGEEYLGNYCISPEHAMVIAGEEYDDYREEVTYRLELVSYEG